ncbi:helix-turn-helix transcriptional regulator [Sinorhizobium fredii]|uniref:helix-turn-helix transcriptional regulator n=1 Tax=Rhizobium fredii TaxID=380 RepID=UPI000595662E|nr:AlpA family phage regulatory protein [Sinorhizobium fredii]WOS61382.1 AlpA family phage regulatory protein [Sinorhizobium fredii GR64]
MTRLLRFADLKKRQIVTSWPQLRRMVERYGFPSGILLGPNTRAWREEEIEDWLARRPTESKPDPRSGTGRESPIVNPKHSA